jgi:hypothetical protein
MKLYTYKDSTDPDYDNIYISSYPMKKKNLVEYTMAEYAPCLDEHASNKPSSAPQRLPAAAPGAPASSSPSPSSSSPAKPGGNIGVDYDNHAVPFSF